MTDKRFESSDCNNFPFPPSLLGFEKSKNGKVLQTLQRHGQFSVFLKLIDACGFEEAIAELDGFTAFAPTDRAFNALDFDDLVDFISKADRAQVAAFVGQFFFPERSHSSSFLNRRIWASSMRGCRMLIDAKRDCCLENARIALFDLECTDGTIHVIDSMIEGSRVYCPITSAVAPNAQDTDVLMMTNTA